MWFELQALRQRFISESEKLVGESPCDPTFVLPLNFDSTISHVHDYLPSYCARYRRRLPYALAKREYLFCGLLALKAT